LIQKFYHRILNNLSSNKIFYKYNHINYKYLDLRKIFFSFIKFLESREKSKNNKICVISEKSFLSYSISISILLSNNTWIPLSSKLPKYRLIKMIKLLNPDIIIVDNKNSKHLKVLKKTFFITTINELNKYRGSRLKKFLITHKPNDIAVIFFTSGSTGEAKGIEIKQSNFLPSFFSQIERIYKNNKKMVFADFHDLSFIISLNILIPCVYSKSTIVPAISNFDNIFPHKHIKKNKVNVLITVPSFMNQIKKISNENTMLNNLKLVVMCGETFHYNLLNYIIENCKKSRIFNCYGSTELSPWVFSYEYKKSDHKIIKKLKIVPIGKKFKFVKFIIHKRELIISGPSVVQGYLNNISDNKKFILKKPYNSFKTGDIALKTRNLIFIKGRKDTQIKMHGFRVDLLDIESTLKINKNISNAIVIVKKKDRYNKIIIALVETKKNLVENHISNFLESKLPFYMMPNKYQIFKNFPKNKNGKVDRKKLNEKVL